MALTAAERAKRYRDGKRDGGGDIVTESLPEIESVTDAVIYPGGPDCGCMMCISWRGKGKDTSYLNHGDYLDADGLMKLDRSGRGRNRVSLPGDLDYVGVG